MYAREDIQRDFDGTKQNVYIFNWISTQLAVLGFHHTAKQFQETPNKHSSGYCVRAPLSEKGLMS